MAKKVSNNLCCKYSQKVIDYATKSDTDALKISSERVIQKSNLIWNKIADKTTSDSTM